MQDLQRRAAIFVADIATQAASGDRLVLSGHAARYGMVGGSGKSRLRSVPGVNVTRTGPRACRALVIGSPLRASWSATAAGAARTLHLNREDWFSLSGAARAFHHTVQGGGGCGDDRLCGG